jgi:hypothetical protein
MQFHTIDQDVYPTACGGATHLRQQPLPVMICRNHGVPGVTVVAIGRLIGEIVQI